MYGDVCSVATDIEKNGAYIMMKQNYIILTLCPPSTLVSGSNAIELGLQLALQSPFIYLFVFTIL